MSRYGELVNDYMSSERRNIKPLPDNISVLWKDIKETQVIRLRGLTHPERMESVYLVTAEESSTRDRTPRSGRGRGGRFKPSSHGYSATLPATFEHASPAADITSWTCGAKGHRSNVCTRKPNVKPIHYTETITVPLFLSTLNTFRPDDDSTYPDTWARPARKSATEAPMTSMLLLDTQSSIHLICNPALLTDIRLSSSPISVQGITRNQIYVPDEGIMYQIEVKAYYSPHTAGNILSYSQLNNTRDCTYDKSADTFTATPRLMGPTHQFVNINCHYSLDIQHVTSTFVASVSSMSYSKKQIDMTRQAYKFIMRMGYISYKSAAEMIQRSSISGIGFTRADLVTAQEISGTPAAYQLGHGTNHSILTSVQEPIRQTKLALKNFKLVFSILGCQMVAIVCDSVICESSQYSHLETEDSRCSTTMMGGKREQEHHAALPRPVLFRKWSPDSKYTVTTGRLTDPKMQNALKRFVSCT